MEFLSKNKGAEYPQKIFEVGKVVELDHTSETKTSERSKLCIMLSGKGAGFTQIKSMMQAVCRELGLKFGLKEITHPSLTKGRAAQITDRCNGIIGELSEETKRNFGLEQDTALLEMEI